MHASGTLAERIACSVDEAEGLSGLSKVAIRAAIKDGRLAATKVGRRWMVSFESLRRLVEGTADPRDEVVQAAADPRDEVVQAAADPRDEVVQAAAELVARTTEAQDLPAQVTDGAALRRIAGQLRAFTPGPAS